MATNSAPKTEVSIVACCFDSQMIGAKLQKMIKAVREHLVLFSPAWSLSIIINVFAKGRRHVKRNCFFHIALQLRPFKGWEGSLVNVRVNWVKDEL
jgi:hypothetical protein